MKKILKEVLEEIRPDAEEEKDMRKKIDDVLKKVGAGLKDVKVVLGGSGAKWTWLKGNYDADIFVKFDYKKFKDRSDELSDILEKSLKKKFRVFRLHGSRDYFQIKKKGFTFEIIPILDIRNAKEAVNITDVSPLHAEFVKKHKKYADDIRLMKKFCRSIGVYGAESYLKGFSGYVIEVLVIYYGGFEKALRAVSRWKDKEVVDIKKYHKNVYLELNKSKMHSPLILVDPVEAGRNAAAALDREKYELFKKKAKGFLKNPSKNYFIEEMADADSLRKRYKKNLLVLEVFNKKGKQDVAGAKLLKVFDFFIRKLKEFGVKEKGWQWDKEKKALFWFVLDRDKLSEFEVRTGPPVKIDFFAKEFKKKHKSSFVKGGRLYAKIKRKNRDYKGFVKGLFRDEYVKEKVKGLKVL